MGFKSIAFVASTLVLSATAEAALVGINDSQMMFLGTSQDGFNITLDTSAGLEWLDWSLTLSRTYNDVFAETQGGSLDGWRYATAAEFESLAISAGMPVTFFDASPGGTDPAFELLNTFLGSGSINNESVAFSATTLFSGTHALGGFGAGQNAYEIPNQNTIAFTNSLQDTTSSSRVGHALVRDAPVVPIPAAVWLFGSGLIGLIGIARRKKA